MKVGEGKNKKACAKMEEADNTAPVPSNPIVRTDFAVRLSGRQNASSVLS